MSARLTVREQIALIAGLRWRLFVNSLGSVRGRLDLVSYLLLWLMMGVMMLGGGLGFAIAAYFFLVRNEPQRLAELFWAVFLFWQLYPILGGMGSAQFDFSNLLRFPLRYGSFFITSLVYGLFDPAAVAAIFWLLCLLAGVAAARLPLLPWAFVMALLFASMNLLLGRAVSTWADRWMAQRRTREIVAMTLVLSILAVDFGVNWASRSDVAERTKAIWLGPLLLVARWLPPGAATTAIAGALAAAPLRLFLGVLLVVLYSLAFLRLLDIRLSAQYRGENLSEANLPAPASRGTASPSARRLRFSALLSGTMGAIIEREALYTLRNWRLLLQFVIAPVFLFIFFLPHSSHGDLFTRRPSLAFPMAVAWALFLEAQWFFNAFGYEGAGIRFLLLAPVRFREVILGKNVFQAVTTALNVFVLWVCVRWFLGPQDLMVVAATLLACVYALLVNLAAGNYMSLRFPTRIELGDIRRSRAMSGTAIFVAFGTQALLVGSGAAAFLAADQLHRPTLALLIFLALAALAGIGYLLVLSRLDGVVERHREALTRELCDSSSS